jgi:phage gp16-like protein
MSTNNLNNKFGECCGCPALMNHDINTTDYVSSRIQYANNKKKAGMVDSHEYRDYLQKNGIQIMMADRNINEQAKCKSNATNKFYIDFEKYDPYSKLTDPYVGLETINDGLNTIEYSKADHTFGGKLKKNDKSKFF